METQHFCIADTLLAPSEMACKATIHHYLTATGIILFSEQKPTLWNHVSSSLPEFLFVLLRLVCASVWRNFR